MCFDLDGQYYTNLPDLVRVNNWIIYYLTVA
jgi:hypothetical protein